MALVEEVEAVMTAREANVFHICAILTESTPEIRKLVFERERAIVEEFPNYEFDFDVIPRHGRELRALAESTAMELTFCRE